LSVISSIFGYVYFLEEAGQLASELGEEVSGYGLVIDLA